MSNPPETSSPIEAKKAPNEYIKSENKTNILNQSYQSIWVNPKEPL